MLLFAGPVDRLRDTPAWAWGERDHPHQQAPHLAWPADRQWCLAAEVDEELEFTVGCSEAAAETLTEVMRGAARRIDHGQPGPIWNDR